MCENNQQDISSLLTDFKYLSTLPSGTKSSEYKNDCFVESCRTIRNKIRKELKRKILPKQQKFLEQKAESIAERLFNLQDKIVNLIKNRYKDRITDFKTNWYIENNSVIMNFSWMDQELTVSVQDEKPVLEGCPKKLRFLKHHQTILEFMLLDKEFYTLQEFPLS